MSLNFNSNNGIVISPKQIKLGLSNNFSTEIKKSVQSNSIEIEKQLNFCEVRNESIDIPYHVNQSSTQEFEESHLGSPTIPDSVYSALPELLIKSLSVFSDQRQKDIFLTAALGVVGGCMDNVKGVYHNDLTFPTLFAFITAPAASGKGGIKYAKMLGQKIHNDLVSQKETKTLFLPANSSSAAVIKHLSLSGGKGIMFESEADTLNNTLKQDWGNFDDMLRKSFHHEPISYSRIANSEFIQIEQPRLSVVLSGTPNQLANLIRSAENGLFSRFIYYSFESELVWNDARPNPSCNYHDHFSELSINLADIVEHLKTYPTNFSFSDAQWDKHSAFFSEKLKMLSNNGANDLAGVLKRMGCISYRIAMILSAMAKAEAKTTDEKVECSDSHFEAAMALTSVYFSHSMLAFKRMSKTISNDNPKQKLFAALPEDVFSRDQAIQIGKSIGIADRTVDKYLKDYKNTMLVQQNGYGKYKKN